jgi:hypothetical protein
MSSMWKGKFFLQTGLPDSLPRAPTVVYGPDCPPPTEAETRKRLTAEAADGRPDKRGRPGVPTGRGKDINKRRVRFPILFNFFEGIHALEAVESAGASDSAAPTAGQRKARFQALGRPERAYWDFMHALFVLYCDQQAEVRVTDHRTLCPAKLRKALLTDFYHLPEPAQLQLVRDHLAVRWHDENQEFVKQSLVKLDRKLITDIRRDVEGILQRIKSVIGTPARRPRT